MIRPWNEFGFIKRIIKSWHNLKPIWIGLVIGIIVYFWFPPSFPDSKPYAWRGESINPYTGTGGVWAIRDHTHESVLYMFPFMGIFVGFMVKMTLFVISEHRSHLPREEKQFHSDEHHLE